MCVSTKMEKLMISKKITLVLLLGLITCSNVPIKAWNIDSWYNTTTQSIIEKIKQNKTAALGVAGLAAVGLVGYGLKKAYEFYKNKTNQTVDLAKLTHLSHPSFAQWKKSCDQLPHDPDNYPKADVLTNELMCDVLQIFLTQNKKELQKIKWLNNEKPDAKFFSESETSYRPHVQKLSLPSNANIAIHGDVHGDIHSLNNFIMTLQNQGHLNDFKIIDPSFYMLFLGDYTDRGAYGAEVMYAILRLKIENPDRVFLVRGNHEDLDINKKGRFIDELCKFKDDFVTILELVYSMYERLPLAIYLGVDNKKEFALCCHGGLEWGYDPANLLKTNNPRVADWVKQLNRQSNIQSFPKLKLAVAAIASKLPKKYKNEYKDILPTSPQDITNGFMWFDFDTKKDENEKITISFQRGRSWMLGQNFTQQLMEKDNIKCILRAHQHGDLEMMKLILNHSHMLPDADTGVCKLWNVGNIAAGQLREGMVLTFCVSPNSGFGHACNYTYDAFGILHLAPSFDSWRLSMYRVDSNGMLVQE